MRKIKRFCAIAFAIALASIGLAVNAESASAWPAGPGDVQIGWVLDASGSVQCVVKAGTNNHVVCWGFTPGSNGNNYTTVVDDWLPYACLGGAYMIAGNNAGVPAYVVYRNVPGYNCSRPSATASSFKAGTCWNQATWNEGVYSNNYAYAHQAGTIFPSTYSGGNWYSNCQYAGNTTAGHLINYG